CATAESLLITERGLVRFKDIVDGRQKLRVASGKPGAVHPITDFHKEENVPTIRITTRRGYTIEGALKHRVRLEDGSWACLQDVRVGDRVALAAGTEVWPGEPIPIDYASAERDTSLTDDAEAAGTSLWTVLRHRAGRRTGKAEAIDSALAQRGYREGR